MLSSTISKKILDMEENVPFPPGEHRYELIKDIFISKIKEKNDSLSERVELFFSLNNVKNPYNRYSFGISIINNKKIGILYIFRLFKRWDWEKY